MLYIYVLTENLIFLKVWHPVVHLFFKNTNTHTHSIRLSAEQSRFASSPQINNFLSWTPLSFNLLPAPLMDIKHFKLMSIDNTTPKGTVKAEILYMRSLEWGNKIRESGEWQKGTEERKINLREK